jgi:hypothetical protein
MQSAATDGSKNRGHLYSLTLQNIRAARRKWAPSVTQVAALRSLSEKLRLSVVLGDLILLEEAWYVTHGGLVRLAQRRRCAGVHVQPAFEFCDPDGSRWAFKATVFRSPKCKGFVGYGDADPSNVSAKVRGAEMRVAETRAVNRALRKAYGIGICSVEELGALSGPLPPAAGLKVSTAKPESTNGNGHHPLRDRLCLLIRQHRLDAALVKAYAADYCEVAELREANREQIAAFAKHLAEYAENDREALICQLNSYAPKPVSPAEGVVAASGEEKTAGAA